MDNANQISAYNLPNVLSDSELRTAGYFRMHGRVFKPGLIEISLTAPKLRSGPEAINIPDLPPINSDTDAYKAVLNHFTALEPDTDTHVLINTKKFNNTYAKVANIGRAKEKINRLF